ncbi:ligated ion channel l-glutamate- and glycine-binding site domain-containing protein [Ditylenchus destructor]|nr:ligated ion channel l-glutamate- and glycine-binding site domain-containing protein [Ditylenchus destructor]
MDTGTLLEVFKFLNYCELAKNGLSSKRFSDLIRTHRHRLAYLDVSYMTMKFGVANPGPVKIFNDELSSEAYNEWVVHNRYSKHIPVGSQVAMKQNTQYNAFIQYYAGTVYYMNVYFKDPNHVRSDHKTTIFSARAVLNHENWPLFQHFVRLLTDPFIFIRSLSMTPPSDVLNLLAGAMNSDCNRVQCMKLESDNRSDNVQEFMSWIKDHICCDTVRIDDGSFLKNDSLYFDFFMTAQCTTAIVRFYDLSNVVIDLVQKFMGLKTCDENQTVGSIRGAMKDQGVVEVLKRNYATFVEDEMYGEYGTLNQVIKFPNNNIGKKLLLKRNLYGFLNFLVNFSILEVFTMGKTKFWDAMNKTVKVVVPQIKPPYVNYANYTREYERSEKYGPGIVWEILREMAESLNLTYDILPLDCPDRHNSNTQDNWDCAFNKLMRGSADIIVGGSVMKGKSNRSDVTFPFFHQKSGILIRNAEFSNFVSMALFEAFSWEVWLGVVVSVFAAFAFLRIIHKTASALLDSNPRQSSAMDSFWVVFSIFTRQTFRGLVEALQESRFKVVMDINSKAQAKMIQTRNHSLLGLLRHEVRVNKKVVYIDGIMNGVRLVQSKPGYALIGSMDVLDILARVECNIVLLKDPVLTTYLTIPVRKTSPYKDYLNRRIPQLIQFGFIEKWTRDYTMALGAKNMRTCPKRNLWNLALKQYQNIFVFLVFGLGVSIFAFTNSRLVETKKLRKSARLAERKANSENKTKMGTVAKRNRSDDKISNIATFDNDTLLEAFKHLNYDQLATRSLVSKRYRDVIQTHRHSLARLYVQTIYMSKGGESEYWNPLKVKIFNEMLSPEAYNEWVVRNQYSKQIPVNDAEQSTNDRKVYRIQTLVYYNDLYNPKSALTARTELNNETWPIFQHFVRLLTDPFIYIHRVELTSQNDVLNLLSGAMHQDHNRLQCNQLSINDQHNTDKFLSWAKDHLHCNAFQIINFGYMPSNYDAEFLDFFMTGANCTPKVDVRSYDLSKVVIDFVQKFMDLKSCDDYQVVESIEGTVETETAILLKRDYADFIVNASEADWISGNITFEFTNNNIGKKVACVLRYWL